MSLENEIQSAPEKAAESLCESKKHSKILYTRDFLLSLSELDVCKKLPSAFDKSLLSGFEDAYSIQDWQRIPGSYGSSPPSRGDSSNYSRGAYGRWDNRSSGRSDKDTDSQSGESESGRRYGSLSRRSWQSPEHDGLLGSGSFPRPAGYTAGLSAPKVRSNDQYQLSRSNEPYHPPRPYKAVPHSRRGTNDSYNDETFGSTDTSEDRAEEERRRRVSFELMRKEQQKAFQEQKLNSGKHKDDHVSDITDLLEDTKDGTRVISRSYKLDESVTQPLSNSDSNKSSLQTPAFRPLAPPGFGSMILERNSSSGSLTHVHSAEVGRPEIEEKLTHAIAQNGTLDNQEGRQTVQNMGFREQQHENTNIYIPSLNKDQQVVYSSADLEISNKNLGADNSLYSTSSLSEASEALDSSEIIEFDTKKAKGHKIIDNSKEDNSTSILDKLFNSAFTVNLSGSSGFVERHDAEQDDTWSPTAVQSSKFAQWFIEDGNKVAEDPKYARPNHLLSLIVGGEKGVSQVSDVKVTQHIPPDLPLQNNDRANNCMTYSNVGISEQFHNCSKEVSAILTCEDLEQTILSEYNDSSSNLQATVPGWTTSDTNTEESKADFDDHASQQLLSLLQKGTDLKDNTQSLNSKNGASDKLNVSEGAVFGSALDYSREETAENIHHSGNSLTLETLFGSAFMKELQSVEAPVSIQRGPVGSAKTDFSGQQGISPRVMGDSLFPTSTVGIGSIRSSHESNVLQSQGQLTKSDKIESWLGFNDTKTEFDQPKHRTDVTSRLGGFDGATRYLLPEEESLIKVSDSVNTPNSLFLPDGNSMKGELSRLQRPIDMDDKLAAFNTEFKDERAMVGQEGPPFGHVPYDQMEPEIPYRNLHAQPSSPQFHPQMNHRGPLFHPLDSHPNLNSQMNLMAPEGIIHHGDRATHQFPPNMMRPPFHQPSTGQAGFGQPPFHQPHTGAAGFELPPRPMLQQQMLGNFPPPHILREFSRGGPPPLHSSNQAAGFTQELNPMQGFPLRQQQLNLDGHGMPLPAPDVSGGSNPPEAFQRFLEMERRANSKQVHPFAGIGHSQGMYGHELDMGLFRQR